MNGRSERETVPSVKISFNSVRASARRGVEMNANKNGVAVLVRDRNAGSERDENVAVSRHHNAITVRLEDSLQTLRDVEVHCFLAHALARDSAAIETAMTCVDDNRGRWTTAFRNGSCACLCLRTRRWSCARRIDPPFACVERTRRG